MITRYVLISHQSHSKRFLSGWYLSRKNLFVCLLGVLALTFLFFGLKSIHFNSSTNSKLTNNSNHAELSPNPNKQSELNGYQLKTGASSVSNTSLDLKSNSTSSKPGKSSTKTKLTVNGADVPVSGNSIHKTFHSSDGSTNINISVQSSTSSSGQEEGM